MQNSGLVNFAPESCLPLVRISSIYRKTIAKAWNWYQRWLWRNGNRISVWNIPSGKTGLPFQMFRCYRKFSVRTTKKCFVYKYFGHFVTCIFGWCCKFSKKIIFTSKHRQAKFSRFDIFFVHLPLKFRLPELSRNKTLFWLLSQSREYNFVPDFLTTRPKARSGRDIKFNFRLFT